MAALFGVIMNNERAERVVIDLEGDDTMTSNKGNEQQAENFRLYLQPSVLRPRPEMGKVTL